jgi:hemerythrin-like domain-containing protein
MLGELQEGGQAMATRTKAEKGAGSPDGADRKAASGTKSKARRKTAAARRSATAAKKRPAPGKAAAKQRAAVKKSPGRGGSDAGYDRSARTGKRSDSASSRAPEQPLMKTLRAEHRHIARVLELFGDQLEAIEQGQLVDTHVVYEIMDYMVNWPDRFHHPREDLIYGRVAEIDAAAADNVDTLQRDHDQMAGKGREVLRDIERWRRGEVDGRAVVEGGRAYVEHLYQHMNNEERLVFPQIEAVLGSDDWRDLAADDQLRPLPDPVFGTRVQREFRNLARKLRRNVRRGVEQGTMVEWISIEALMESLEVVSMAYESARDTAVDHIRAALDDSRDLFRESPLSAPLRCAVNNARLTARLLENVADISRDTMDDLARVNQERKDRMRLLRS